MKTKLPDIYEYNDFRKYLRDFQLAKSSTDKRYTKSNLSRLLGLPNTRSYFTDVLKGKKVTNVFIDRFIGILRLDKGAAKFFRALVQFNQAENPDERELFLDQLIALNQTPKRIIDKNAYEYYKTWHNSSVRALLNIYDFNGDYSSLANKVFPPISVNEAKEAIRVLKNLGLIDKNPKGFFKPVDKSIATSDGVRDELIKQYQMQCFELAIHCLIKNRELPQSMATNVVSISDAGYKRIEKRIQKFRSEIRSLVHKDNEPAKNVYQLNVSFFPNSK
jgi:uncharacterized protein (TIGR02147 family)